LNYGRTLAITVLVLVCACGMALADNPVNQTPETQGITVTTNVVCQGLVTQSTSVVWQQSSAALDSPPLSATESQYTMSYQQNMIADQGYTEYTGRNSLDTSAKVANQNNFESTKQIDFVGSDTGRITYSEDLLLDGAGTASGTASRMLCPFASSASDTIPAFCNVVEMGSTFDGKMVSMMTDVSERHVTATADPGVAAKYNVQLSGVGTASAYIKAHLMEGRIGTVGETSPSKALDTTYEETTTASGQIADFLKQMSYESGMRRI